MYCTHKLINPVIISAMSIALMAAACTEESLTNDNIESLDPIVSKDFDPHVPVLPLGITFQTNKGPRRGT